MNAANRGPARPVPQAPRADVDRFRAQHLALGRRRLATDIGTARVTVDEAESPLAWLARRRGRAGRAYVEPHQVQAGERLRADFTYANLIPRTTSNWASPVAKTRAGSGGIAHVTDAMVAARQRVHQALDTVGPEFAGLLLDVCCFLKRLEDVERERVWPARSAKVVLQLALDRLARHYGYAAETRGPAHSPLRIWLAEGATVSVDGASEAGS